MQKEKKNSIFKNISKNAFKTKKRRRNTLETQENVHIYKNIEIISFYNHQRFQI